METPASTPWTFEKTIPSDTSIGSELVGDLLDAMTARNWPPSELFRVQLAYEEAIVNAIRHGNKCDSAKTVVVQMTCDEDEVRIEITDQGNGFELSDVPDPRDEALLEAPGGRGVLLISEIMSEVHYNGTGNQIRMVKRRGVPPMDDAE